jgi:serine O-acetyltransferase
MFFKKLREDINFAKKVDPAARNKFEIFMTYSGVHALSIHRGANFLHRIHLKFLARWLSQFRKWLTGIVIRTAAQIAGGIFIDHGTGVVIGETSIVETEVTIYQGVTLGGTGKDKGARRHPTVKKGAIISCGAKVLGNITIGENSVVGASSVVLKDVPPNSTAVGIPARIVKINGEKVREGYDIPDIVKEEIDSLKMRVEQLEKMLNLQKGEQNESL